MRERVAELVGPRGRHVGDRRSTPRACASCGARPPVGLKSTFSIYDAADSQRLMTLVVPRARPRPQAVPAAAFSAQVSNLKNELVDDETFAARASNDTERMLAEAYTALPGTARARPTRSTSTT